MKKSPSYGVIGLNAQSNHCRVILFRCISPVLYFFNNIMIPLKKCFTKFIGQKYTKKFVKYMIILRPNI